MNSAAEPSEAERSLAGKVCVVTGSSRGIGRGIARAFGERGGTVYITGRTLDGERSVGAAAADVDVMGGRGIPIQVDHADDDQIAALFERVRAESGRVDVLVNNVFKVPQAPVGGGGFWDHPLSHWDDQVGVGLRAHYYAAWHAADLLFAAAPGSSIVNVSSPGGVTYQLSASYGVGKAGLDRMTADMAIELEPKGVSTFSLYPGMVSTEDNLDRVAAGLKMDPAAMQTPLFVGRCVAALVTAEGREERSGTVQWVEDLALEFDILDENGKRPPGIKQYLPV